MIVINPTNSEITVSILGNDYTVPANGQLAGVPDTVALHWKNRLHNFLVLKSGSAPVAEKLAKEPEVQVEQAKEDEPIKKPKSK